MTVRIATLPPNTGDIPQPAGYAEEREAELVEPTRPRDIRYCFKFEGQTICVTLPRIVHQVE